MTRRNLDLDYEDATRQETGTLVHFIEFLGVDASTLKFERHREGYIDYVDFSTLDDLDDFQIIKGAPWVDVTLDTTPDGKAIVVRSDGGSSTWANSMAALCTSIRYSGWSRVQDANGKLIYLQSRRSGREGDSDDPAVAGEDLFAGFTFNIHPAVQIAGQSFPGLVQWRGDFYGQFLSSLGSGGGIDPNPTPGVMSQNKDSFGGGFTTACTFAGTGVDFSNWPDTHPMISWTGGLYGNVGWTYPMGFAFSFGLLRGTSLVYPPGPFGWGTLNQSNVQFPSPFTNPIAFPHPVRYLAVWAMKSDIICFENLPKGAWVSAKGAITAAQEARISADSSVPGTHSVTSKIYLSDFGAPTVSSFSRRFGSGFTLGPDNCPNENPLHRKTACADGDTVSLQFLGKIYPVSEVEVRGLDPAVYGVDRITLAPPNGVWGGDCFRFAVGLGPIATYTDADVDLEWNGRTYLGLGKESLRFDAVRETEDVRGGSINIEIPAEHRGSTLDVIAENNRFRGTLCRIYAVHYRPGTGVRKGAPTLMFQGHVQSGPEVREGRAGSGSGEATIRLRVASRMGDLDRTTGIRANATSHQVYYPGDTFFEAREQLIGKEIPWGVGT